MQGIVEKKKKIKKMEMSDCKGVSSYITGHLQPHRCVTVKWNIEPLGRGDVTGCDGSCRAG